MTCAAKSSPLSLLAVDLKLTSNLPRNDSLSIDRTRETAHCAFTRAGNRARRLTCSPGGTRSEAGQTSRLRVAKGKAPTVNRRRASAATRTKKEKEGKRRSP